MALTRLTCPDCGTVLRPAKPVTGGKKVKCPNCDLIFLAGEAEEEDAPRRTSSKSSKSSKKSAPKSDASVKQKKAPKKKAEEEEIYGYIRDPDEDDEDAKPKIDYAPDESIRDLRGPAIVKLTSPASKLQLVGMAGVAGWLMLFIVLMIPTVFPVTPDDDKGKEAARAGAAGASGGKKAEAPTRGLFELMGVDLSEWFLMLMIPLILLMVYSSLVVAGGIKMQNLESRAFAIAGSIMAMLPVHTGGVQVLLSLVVMYICTAGLDDPEFGGWVSLGFSAIVYLISLSVGIWCLKTLMDQEVIDGFEFDPD